jgi:hypothetical protein
MPRRTLAANGGTRSCSLGRVPRRITSRISRNAGRTIHWPKLKQLGTLSFSWVCRASSGSGPPSYVSRPACLVFIFLHLHSHTGPQAIIYITGRSYADQSQLQTMVMAATGVLPCLVSDATPFRVWCSAHLLATTGLGARRAPPLGLLACPPAATWRFPFYKPDPRWPATLNDPREACQLLALGAALTSADTVRQFAVKEGGAPVIPVPAEKV